MLNACARTISRVGCVRVELHACEMLIIFIPAADVSSHVWLS